MGYISSSLSKVQASESLLNDFDKRLAKLNKSQLILSPDETSNKHKIVGWIQKGCEDVMGDKEKDSEEKVKALMNVLYSFCVTCSTVCYAVSGMLLLSNSSHIIFINISMLLVTQDRHHFYMSHV